MFYGVPELFTTQVGFIPVLGGASDLVLALGGGVAGALLGRFAFGCIGSLAYGLAAAAVGGLVFPRAGTLPAGFVAGAMFWPPAPPTVRPVAATGGLPP